MKHIYLVGTALLALAACGAPTAQTPTSPPVPATAQPPTVAPTPIPTIAPTRVLPTATLAPTPTAVPTAEPTVAPTATPEPAAAPNRLVIDAIGLDYTVVPVGLDANLAPIVLDHDVAWYNLSAKPTEGENIVFWAHVLRFRATPKIPAPFEQVKTLEPGARLALIDALGTRHEYRITDQILATPDQVKYILPQGREMVTLVSCYGDAVFAGDGNVVDMSKRLITIAEPVSSS